MNNEMRETLWQMTKENEMRQHVAYNAAANNMPTGHPLMQEFWHMLLETLRNKMEQSDSVTHRTAALIALESMGTVNLTQTTYDPTKILRSIFEGLAQIGNSVALRHLQAELLEQFAPHLTIQVVNPSTARHKIATRRFR